MIRYLAVPILLAAAAPAQTAADALFEKARAAQVAGRLTEAESVYNDYLKRYGPTPEVLANLGALLARREDYAQAIRRYQQALKLDPALHPLHLNLGLAYLKQGQADTAVTELDLFLKAQPGHRQAMQLRAMALLEAEKYADSEQQYRALLPSDEISVMLGLSTAMLRQNKAAEARAVLEPLLARRDSAEAQLAMGQLLVQEGRSDEALAALEQARKLNPELPQLKLAIGSVYWRQRRTEDAIKEWRAEYAAQPNSFEATYTLGSALALNPEMRTEAEVLLRKATTLRPRHGRANYQLGKLLWQKSRSPEAIKFVQRATEVDPNLREAFFLQGTMLQSLGRKTEAAKAFTRVKELSKKELDRQRDLFSVDPPEEK